MQKLNDSGHEFLMEHDEAAVRVWIDDVMYLEVTRREEGGAYVAVRAKGQERPLREIWARAWPTGTVAAGDIQ